MKVTISMLIDYETVQRLDQLKGTKSRTSLVNKILREYLDKKAPVK